ncbi:MAG: tetratricopeptide repeat protein [Pseudomonadota bacterium]
MPDRGVLRGLCGLLVALAFVWSASAAADQNDPRLDGLFAQLAGNLTATEARRIENQIWRIWYGYDGDNEEVDRLMAMGRFANRSGFIDLAHSFYSQVIEADPEFAEGWNRRATVNYLRGALEESLADIERTLALEPRHFGALAGQGLVYLALNEPERALAAFEAALEVNPHLSGARANAETLRDLVGEDV